MAEGEMPSQPAMAGDARALPAQGKGYLGEPPEAYSTPSGEPLWPARGPGHTGASVLTANIIVFPLWKTPDNL